MKKLVALLVSMLMVLSLVACSNQPAATGGYKAGTYTGTGQGFGGDIVVEVVLSTDKIESITVTENSETDGIGSIAIEKLPGEMVAAQSVQVDGISGATLASDGIKEAVTNALKEAGVDASTLVPQAAAEGTKEEQTLDCDVVILGAGGAGMAAALEAANAGKTVIILEKTALTGGNSVRSTGGMNATGTPYQNENTFEEGAGVEKTIAAAKENYPELAELTATVEQQYADYLASGETTYFDSVELFMLDTLVGGKNLNNYELVQTLASESAGAIEWLHSIGADLTSVGSFGGASVKRIHRPVNEEGKTISVGSYLIPIFTEACESNANIQIIYEAPATEIIMTDGVATGVKADGYTINAKAVVITTGGFGANLDMVTELKPDLAGFVTTNAPGITGDGIKMAEAVGAATVDMDQIQIHPTVEQTTSALITEGLRGDGAILVNQEGERFCDEVGTRDAVSAAEIAQTGSYAYLIVDQKMVDASNVIQGYISKGYAVEGETIEDLATAIESDPATLASTLETWNGYVASKNDADFGRTSFAEALDTAPYYAIKIAPGVHHTMGGIVIDTKTQVLDTEGNAIPGLFAAGEVTGGVHGANRLGGNAVADFVVFGRIAGQSAAEFAK